MTGSLGEISTNDKPIVGLPGDHALTRAGGAAEVVAGDVVRHLGRDEGVVDLVDAEVVELGKDPRQVVAVALHVAPPRRALHARVREQRR